MTGAASGPATTAVARPKTLKEALSYRRETGATPFGGGTDLMVRYRGYTGTAPRMSGPVLFLDAVPELREIRLEGEAEGSSILWIGAGVTMSQLLGHPQTPELLRRAVDLIAAPALRNRATLGGNICNASPAADTLPPLYIHDAEAVVISADGERTLPLEEFLTGPGTSALGPEEILLAVRVPLLKPGELYYRKVGTRRANALSKLSAAGYARIADGRIEEFRFSLGAVAPRVVRLREVETATAGLEVSAIDEGKRAELLALAAPRIRPIDDQRSTAEYRRRVATNALGEFFSKITNI